jgi:hypothetical protein
VRTLDDSLYDPYDWRLASNRNGTTFDGSCVTQDF